MRARATEMRREWRLSRAVPALMLGVAFALGACTDEETVFVERPIFETPADSASQFVGYLGDVEEKQTVCGNCHATFQSGWETTGHADAWDGLQESGHAQGFCEECHAISELGNTLTDPAGVNVARVERYYDVQCESCHGPGFDHINDPMVANAPLCSISADTASTTGCAECHEGTHHPFVEQWSQTPHANVTGFAAARAGCNECHEGRVALERKFYDTSNYVEKNDTEIQPITCAICHDPHGTDFEANLRAPVTIAGEAGGLPSEDHLCVRCHARRGTPPSTHGPHAAQGLLVIQESIGWLPAGFEAPSVGSHGNPEANPEICVTCHVASFELTDEATGEFQFQSVGHTFEALPCVDEAGIPFVGDCEDSERTFVSCTECHTQAQARTLYDDLQTELHALLDQLWVDDDADGVMDATDTGLLPQVIALGDSVDLDPRDDLITVPEGVMWNAQIAHTDARPWFADAHVYEGIAGEDLAGIEWESHKASGNGVHNPNFLEALLEASIAALEAWLLENSP